MSLTTGLLEGDGLSSLTIPTRFVDGRTIETRCYGALTEDIEWQFEKDIGYGQYGRVWLEKSPQVVTKRVVKEVRKQSPGVDFKREISALQALRSYENFIVRLFGFFEAKQGYPPTSSYIYIVMEYFPLGDLFKLLTATDSRPLVEEDAKYIGCQLLHCLHICHGMGIAHRDLKPQNVFVVQRFPFWWLKLGDFGLSKQVTMEEPSLKTKVGTPAFEAPEVGDPKTSQYTNAVDIWSLGCLLYWVHTKAVPFYTPGHGTLNDFIRDEARFPLRGLTEKNVSEDGIDFLTKTIIVNPDERLTAVTALNHSWLRGLSSWDRTLARKIAQMPDPRSINEHDIILVLGPTGVGKSRFIRHFAAGGGPVEGKKLTSETQSMQVFRCVSRSRRFLMVDTPGFDDTYRSETSIFDEIVAWLASTFSSDIRLTGLILMTRISDIRLQGSLRRSLKYVRKLCGPHLEGLVHVSTFWDRLESEEAGMLREADMRDMDEFAWLTDRGPSFRSDGSKATAEAVVQYLLDRSRPMTLKIQQELVEQGQPMHQTAAGVFLVEEMAQIRDLYEEDIARLLEELKEAARENDKEVQELLQMELQDLLSRVDKIDQDSGRMKMGYQEMMESFATRRRKEWSSLMAALRHEDPEDTQHPEVAHDLDIAQGLEDTQHLEAKQDREATKNPGDPVSTDNADAVTAAAISGSKRAGKLSKWAKSLLHKLR